MAYRCNHCQTILTHYQRYDMIEMKGPLEVCIRCDMPSEPGVYEENCQSRLCTWCSILWPKDVLDCPMCEEPTKPDKTRTSITPERVAELTAQGKWKWYQ